MISPQNTCSVWNISDGAKLLIFYESQIPLTTGSFATQTFYIRCNYLGGLEQGLWLGLHFGVWSVWLFVVNGWENAYVCIYTVDGSNFTAAANYTSPESEIQSDIIETPIVKVQI